MKALNQKTSFNSTYNPPNEDFVLKQFY